MTTMDSSSAFHHSTPSTISWVADASLASLPASTPLHDHAAPRRRQPTRASKSGARKSLEAAAAAERHLSPSPADDFSKRQIPMSRPRNPSSASLDLPSATMRLTRTGRPSKALKGQAVHACDQCGKVYTRAEHMRRHQRNHTQILRCDLEGCGKIFHRSDMLERHQENHHGGNRDSRTGSVASHLSDEQSFGSPAMMAPHRSSLSEHASSYPSPLQHGADGTLEVGGMFTPLDTPVLGSSSLPSRDGSDAGSYTWNQPGFESPMPVFADAGPPFLQDAPSDYSQYAYPPPPASAGAANAWYPAYVEPEANAPTANMGFLPPAWRLAGEPTKAWNHAPNHAPQPMFLDPAFDHLAPMHTPQSMHDMPSTHCGSDVSSLDLFDHDRKYAH